MAKFNKQISFIPYNPKLKSFARTNRKNPTPAEKKIWDILSRQQFAEMKFTRQKPLDNFIVDFYCPQLLLAIEIDGDSHTEQELYDDVRSNFLMKKYGVEVIRYNNHDVLNNPEGVYIDLFSQVLSRKQFLSKTHPNPPLSGREPIVSPPDKGESVVSPPDKGELEGV